MILRKPYAFFIKYFKLIHFLMAILMILILVQTNSFLLFLNETLNSNELYLGHNIAGNVFDNLSYLYIALVIAMDIMIWILLEFKKKKRLFYVLNLFAFLMLTALYVYMNVIFDSMSKQIVDTRLLMVLRDFSLIAFTIQTGLLFITIIRALGINIKKFDFKSDLKNLDLLESDNEEFEVNLEFDYEKLKRSFRTTFRNFRYYVKENIRMIIPIFVVFIVLVGVFIYKNTKGFVTEYKQGTIVNYPDYSIVVKETYITNKNYQLNSITDDSMLVLLKTSIKTTTNKPVFEFGRFSLRVGSNKFYHDIKYTEHVKDIGNGYIKQKLSKDFTEYLLIFEIPKNLMNEKMELAYVNDVSAGIFGQDRLTVIGLQPTNLDVEVQEQQIKLNETVLIDNKFSNKYELLLEEVSVSDVFKIKYKHCIKNTAECFDFYEPLQADFSGSFDKAILRLKISLTSDGEKLNNELNLLEMYGSLQYKLSGKDKVINIKKQLLPSYVKSNYTYYEIPYEVLNSESVRVRIKTRKKIYVYELKVSVE